MDDAFDDFVEYLVCEFLIEEEILWVDDKAAVEERVVFPDLDLDVLGQHPVGYSELVLIVFKLQDLLFDVVFLVLEINLRILLACLACQGRGIFEVEIDSVFEFAENALAGEHRFVVSDICLGRRDFETSHQLSVHENGLIHLEFRKAFLYLLLVHDLIP
jgi:hypothetical protein